jgi:hypothetical protein
VKVVVKKQDSDEYRHEPHSWYKATYSGLDETAWGRYLTAFSGPAVHPSHALGFFSQPELAAKAEAEAGSHEPKKALDRLTAAAPINKKKGGDSRRRSSTLGTINPNGATLQLCCISAKNSLNDIGLKFETPTNGKLKIGKGRFKFACMKENQCW